MGFPEPECAAALAQTPIPPAPPAVIKANEVGAEEIRATTTRRQGRKAVTLPYVSISSSTADYGTNSPRLSANLSCSISVLALTKSASAWVRAKRFGERKRAALRDTYGDGKGSEQAVVGEFEKDIPTPQTSVQLAQRARDRSPTGAALPRRRLWLAD
jgi:hypothetical protein